MKAAKLILVIVIILTIGCKSNDSFNYYNRNPYSILLTVNDFRSDCYANEDIRASNEKLNKGNDKNKLELEYDSKFRNDINGLSLSIHNLIIVCETDSDVQNAYKEHWSDFFLFIGNDSLLTKSDLNSKLKFGRSTYTEIINKETGIKTYFFEGIKRNKSIIFSISGCLNRDFVTNKLTNQINKLDSL